MIILHDESDMSIAVNPVHVMYIKVLADKAFLHFVDGSIVKVNTPPTQLLAMFIEYSKQH